MHMSHRHYNAVAIIMPLIYLVKFKLINYLQNSGNYYLPLNKVPGFWLLYTCFAFLLFGLQNKVFLVDLVRRLFFYAYAFLEVEN